MYPRPIQKLINLFSEFPTIGRRTAGRFVFYLLRLPPKEINDFLDSIVKLRKMIKTCAFCFNPFDASAGSAQISSDNSAEILCSICRNNLRDKNLLCIMEKEIDLISIEKTKKYKGLYFILGGTINFKKDNKNIRIKELKERIKNPKKFGLNADFKEIIMAFNPTPEGEATSLYVERELKPFKIKITRLGRGLPIGGELEYADEETLRNSFEGRK
jgi:recombination protein RecR